MVTLGKRAPRWVALAGCNCFLRLTRARKKHLLSIELRVNRKCHETGGLAPCRCKNTIPQVRRYPTFFPPDGFGEKVHMASPIKQIGASKSQTPIPNFWPAGELPLDKLGVASWMGAAGVAVDDCCAGNGEGAELRVFGRKSDGEEVCVQCGEFGKLD